MKKWTLLLALALVVVYYAATAAQSQNQVARAVSLEGQVDACLVSKKNWKTVRLNQEFTNENMLKTWENAKTDLHVYPEDYIRINENTELEIMELTDEAIEVSNPIIRLLQSKPRQRSRTRVRLLGGRIFTSVHKRSQRDQFIIETGTAIIGIRGSSNSVEKNPKTGVVEVVQVTGISFVWAPGREQFGVELGPGKMTSVEPGGNPETPSFATGLKHTDIMKDVMNFTAGHSPTGSGGGETGGNGDGDEGGDGGGSEDKSS